MYLDIEHTFLGTIMEQMTVKNKRGKTNKCFDEDMALMKKVLPKGNNCPADYDEVKTMLADLGLEVQKIDACVNNCMLYYKENEAEDECRHCYEPRYQAASTSSKQKNCICRVTVMFCCNIFFPLSLDCICRVMWLTC